MARAAAGSLLLFHCLLFDFAAISAADATCNATGINAEEDGLVRGSVLLQHQNVLPKVVGEASDALEAHFHDSGGVELPEGATPEHVGSEVLSLAERTESQVTKHWDPFFNHWITLADKNLWNSYKVKHIYKSVDGMSETWGGAVVWQVDLGDDYFIEKLKIEWRICKCMLDGSLLIDGSFDRVHWHTFQKPKGLYVFGGKKTTTYNSAAHVRHIRIRTTKVSPLRWISMWEVAMYGRMILRNNVYGWFESYQAGRVRTHLHGTEIMHLAVHKGKLFGATGEWMNRGPYRCGNIVRLDCSWCGWAIDGKPSPYAGRIESLKSVRWTTDRNGDLLDPPVESLYAGYYYAWWHNTGGVVSVSHRHDDTRNWAQQYVWKGPWKRNYFSARAIVLHRDKVTNVDRLFVSTGMDGIISGTLAGPVGSSVDWEYWDNNQTETGPLPTRPLALAVFDGNLYVSTGSYIMRRNDGPSPTWSKVFDMADFDKQTVDEAVGGIRGLSSIGSSMLFVWSPNGKSASCIIRLDPNGDNFFTHHQESCVRELASNYLGKNVRGLPALVTFTIAAYNGVLAIPSSGGEAAKHIIGFEMLLYGYSTDDFPINPGQIEHRSGKNLAYYAGGGFLIRHSAEHYEVRQVGGPRYDPKDVYPVYTAVRAYANSPFGDGAVFMGGYDCNHFGSQNTAWVMRGEKSAVFGKPVPCQKELGCGHVPGEPFKRLGCDLCGQGTNFFWKETAYWIRGKPVTCQAVLDKVNNAVNNKVSDRLCQKAKTSPLARRCCSGCDFCHGLGKRYEYTRVAGYAGGRNYTCKDARDYVIRGYTSCYQGTQWWKRACCI